jgi:hypothetical protein
MLCVLWLLLQVLLLAINRYSYSLDRGSSKLHHNVTYSLTCSLCVPQLLQVLLLAINRYSYSLGRGSSKLHHNVTYPLSLRMKPQWTSDDCPGRRSAQYQLIALVTHHGRNASGEHAQLDC